MMNNKIKLSAEQLMAKNDFYNKINNKQVYRLFGPAGTGKTSVARCIADDWHGYSKGGQVHYAAFAWKAAMVMRSKGCEDAGSIHRLTMNFIGDTHSEKINLLKNDIKQIHERGSIDVKYKELPAMRKQLESYEMNNRPLFQDKCGDKNQVDLIILDECSMVNKNLGIKLEKLNCKILVLGDPYQLPPVSLKGYEPGYFTNEPADFMLTQIHRQQANNPIIKLATKIRNKDYTHFTDAGDGNNLIIQSHQLSKNQLLNADQIIAWTQKECQIYNQTYRSCQGWKPRTINIGERVIALTNSMDGRFHKGEQFQIIDILSHKLKKPSIYETSYDKKEKHNVYKVEVQSLINQKVFQTEINGYYLNRVEKPHLELSPWNYAYCTTCHKAQGSEWNNTIIVVDPINMLKVCTEDFFNKWYYTAVTRSSQKLTILMLGLN